MMMTGQFRAGEGREAWMVRLRGPRRWRGMDWGLGQASKEVVDPGLRRGDERGKDVDCKPSPA